MNTLDTLIGEATISQYFNDRKHDQNSDFTRMKDEKCQEALTESSKQVVGNTTISN
eukprot:m.1647683 g.1647683  ORF g.1647683 m.1647683 type:complete len:56 (+) comp75826_c0_seq1:346-513(+)